MKISIIVPVYKTPNEYLKRCLESLNNQTYKDLEIIIVNDGMTEENLKCVETFLKNERFKIIGKENKGVSYARNLGIENAKGEYIAFVDSDDFIDDTFCEKMYHLIIEKKAECAICGYNRVYNNKIEKLNCNDTFCELNQNEYLEKVLNVQEAVGFSHMKLIKKDILSKNKIRFNEKLMLAEDAVFCIRLAKNIKKIVKINEPLYNYQFNSESAVRKYDENYCKKYLDSMIEVKKIIREYNNDRIELLYNNFVAYHVLLIVVNYCFNPMSGRTNKQNIQKLKEILEISEFKEAIKKSNYKKLAITRRITLFFLKNKGYWIISIIAQIRQGQFKKTKLKEKDKC